MLPEHEEFLLDHVEKMGFMFIIDFLKRKFTNLSHEEACAIYEEFKAKHAEDEPLKDAEAQLRGIAKKIGGEFETQLRKSLKDR
jgi:hypothetical protein